MALHSVHDSQGIWSLCRPPLDRLVRVSSPFPWVMHARAGAIEASERAPLSEFPRELGRRSPMPRPLLCVQKRKEEGGRRERARRTVGSIFITTKTVWSFHSSTGVFPPHEPTVHHSQRLRRAKLHASSSLSSSFFSSAAGKSSLFPFFLPSWCPTFRVYYTTGRGGGGNKSSPLPFFSGSVHWLASPRL